MGDLTGRTIHWGILGSGRVAEGFADDLRRIDGVELVAVASRRRQTAVEFSTRHGGPRVHDSYEALVSDPMVDAVYVATPNDRHAIDAIECLRHGKAVLCEKPFTTSGEEARRVIETARVHRVFCMEAMWMRFVPAIRRTVELVSQGAIGQPIMVHADFSTPTAFDPQSRLYDPRRGGGALLDLGVYTLSLAQLLLGEPAVVRSRLQIGPSGVDDHAAVLLGYDDGATAVLTSSLRTRGPNSAVISGTEGTIALPGPICAPNRLLISPTATTGAAHDRYGESTVRRFVRRYPQAVELARSAKRVLPLGRNGAREERCPADGHGYTHEVVEVVQCLREDRLESARMPLDDSLHVVELMERIRSEWSAD